MSTLVAQMVKNLPAMWSPWFDYPWVGKIRSRRKWQPSPVFLPGISRGQRSLAGYSWWGCEESDTSEWLKTSVHPVWHGVNTHEFYIRNQRDSNLKTATQSWGNLGRSQPLWNPCVLICTRGDWPPSESHLSSWRAFSNMWIESLSMEAILKE